MTLTDPYARGSVWSRSFIPLALITLGVVFLLGNLIPERSHGALMVLGLGVALGIGRITTGRYGYAVPAGLLLGLGAHLALANLQIVPASRGPSPFFILLGLGFGLVYLIGGRSSAVWPLFPAAILVLIGLVVLGVSSLGPLAGLSWIVGLWPAALVLLGVWLMFRDELPAGVRRPVATLGAVALLAYGVLAALATVAAGGTFARASFAPGSGAVPFGDSLTLEAPIGAGQTFSVNNTSGHTAIHVGGASTIHATVTRHFGFGGRPPEARLVPNANGVTLDVSSAGGRFLFGPGGGVDYDVEVPAGVQVRAQSSSGGIDVDGVSGDTWLSTSSGQIHASDLNHLREASSSSGSIDLSGVFTGAARVRASSGSVAIRLLPGSNVQLDARTASGSIEPHGVPLSGAATQRHALSGAVGTPAADATLSIETSSGSINLTQ